MQGSIVAQGAELMLYGMGTVVVFLALLVLATTFMSRLIAQYFPDPEPPAVPARQSTQEPARPATLDSRIVAAISAAVAQHRKREK
jgi:oxaloacetate decarboxylase gamma subunit